VSSERSTPAVPFAQIPAGAEGSAERVKPTLCCPSRSVYEQAGSRESGLLDEGVCGRFAHSEEAGGKAGPTCLRTCRKSRSGVFGRDELERPKTGC
jgi:hypothetical protein